MSDRKIKISTIIDEQEKRVAITPETVKKYISIGCDVVLPKNSGISAGFSDNEYTIAGAVVKDEPIIVQHIDVYVSVKPCFSNKSCVFDLPKDSHFIAMLSPYVNKKHLDELYKNGVHLYALEQLPRITRAQAMDVLSSQANIAGYRAVIEAFSVYNRVIPLMMTAAGTIRAAKVLILGAGVAGLQAIATAKRMGAVVSVFDVRSAVKEQVESLGATFIEVENTENGETAGGYAKEMSDDYKRRQSEKLQNIISKVDIVITTAQIPGKPAPLLITQEMFDSMRQGSVIVDMATETGGNCVCSKKDEKVAIDGKVIIGYTDFSARVAYDASQLFARNVFNFVSLMVKDGVINTDDEAIKATNYISG